MTTPPLSLKAAACAQHLRAAAGGAWLAELPEAVRPASAAEAYAAQDAIAPLFGVNGGWKVGAPSPTAEPSCARMPLAFMRPSPADAPVEHPRLRIVECEVAFRLARDLPPPPPGGWSRAEVLDAIATAHPVIELIESRFVDHTRVSPWSKLADSLNHGGFVWGPPVADWRALDFAQEPIALVVDGRTLCEVVGGNTAVDLGRLLVWLANEGAGRRGGLKAGEFVTTGSCTGMTPVAAGAKVEARFGRLGTVSVQF